MIFSYPLPSFSNSFSEISTAEIVEVLSDGEELIPLGKLAQLGRERIIKY
jgi:hypothetical protein